MRILALDQATACGYAVVEDGIVVESGTWQLSDKKRTGESRGMRYVRLEKRLHDLNLEFADNTKHSFDLIVHEQTLLRGGAATELANGFKAIILKFATEIGVDVTCVHTTELKKFATGHGKAEKSEMIQACFDLAMVRPADDNEADAILIGLWAWKNFGV
jgi:Holliday junction resolvasome RuvABC endonuclease subunit